jgi:hypothetical protein
MKNNQAQEEATKLLKCLEIEITKYVVQIDIHYRY